MKRLGFLGSTAAVGTAAVTQAASAQTVPPPPAAAPVPAPRKRFSNFFADEAMNFVLLNMLGQGAYGLGDVGTTLAIFDQIEDGNPASAFNAMTAMGYRIAKQADAARAAGHRISARDLYLQASNYIYQSLYFCDGMGAPEKMLPTFVDSRAAWDKAMPLLGYPVEQVRIPYENTTMPGYFIKADASNRPRPLLLSVNGSDGSVLDMWAQGGKAAVERGYNVLIYDGPGQGAMLWLQHIPFRYDFEAAVTPVVDWLLKRPDVDPKRLAIQGISQGGYWVPRALAFEQRFAAAIADPGVMDVGATWWNGLPPQLVAMLNGGMKAQFDSVMAARMPPARAADLAFRARPFGFASLYDTFIAAKKYTLAGVIDTVTTPMFVSNPDNEQFFPGQPKQLFDALPTAKKVLVPYTVAEGADRHCEPAAPMLRAQKMFDWLDDQLGMRG